MSKKKLARTEYTSYRNNLKVNLKKQRLNTLRANLKGIPAT